MPVAFIGQIAEKALVIAQKKSIQGFISKAKLNFPASHYSK